MSMELEVFSDRRLASTAEWQRAIDAERFPLRLEASVRFGATQGLFPAMLGDKQTGFECFHDEARVVMGELGERNFSRHWRHALGFRWVGSRLDELQAAWMAATAYAVATEGIVFDYEEGRVLTAPQARERVHDIVRDIPAMELALKNIAKKGP